MIGNILHPEDQVELDPTMAAVMDAGVRGLERLRWNMAAGKAPEGL